MKRFLLLVFILHHFVNVAQDTFLKEISTNFFGEGSIIATNDNGWLVLEERNLQLTKYNQCGEFQWSKKYGVMNQNCCIGNQIALGALDEIYLLSRQMVAQNYGFSITALDASGIVLWSKNYGETDNSYYPYSLLKGAKGDLLVFSNKTGIGTGYSTLTKLDNNGVIKWSKKYDNGGTWGEAILTNDTGVLMRRGDEFIKVDSVGQVEWGTRVTTNNTYYYLAPVEVSDGYIFTKQIQGSQEVGFHKLDDQGNLLWGGGKYTSFSGAPNPLRNTANGNFTTVLNTNTNSPTASAVIIEFDKDLNIVKQNAISLNTSNWLLNDVWFSNLNVPLIAGKTSTLPSQHFVFGKLDIDYKVGCDSVINTNFTFYAATSSPVITTVSNNSLTTTSVPVTFTIESLVDFITCSDTKVRVVKLAKDTVICPDTSLILQNLTTYNFANYLWSTGETTPTISVNSSGKYWVECANPCVSTTYSDTIIVAVTQIQNPNLATDTVLCGDNSILLDAKIPLGKYAWQDQSSLPTFLVVAPGNYYVDITFNNCVKRFESNIMGCEDYLIPNIFTPNGDGINDYFQIVYDGGKPFECEIYNRWGVLQFETNTAQFQWDGTIGGVRASDGVYIYLMKIGEKKIKGTITIVH